MASHLECKGSESLLANNIRFGPIAAYVELPLVGKSSPIGVTAFAFERKAPSAAVTVLNARPFEES